ncbi:hypothetical protein KFK09_010499 [Dendrobium nobile]|uniref:Uncharacterized protein n=1 Tax=Dendrobium nobile TaxID=94219 RepID=A0A8T3BA58_DENNO|nr:hypothetical protein KFK09_010499 [Dendrobium nobile]
MEKLFCEVTGLFVGKSGCIRSSDTQQKSDVVRPDLPSDDVRWPHKIIFRFMRPERFDLNTYGDNYKYNPSVLD